MVDDRSDGGPDGSEAGLRGRDLIGLGGLLAGSVIAGMVVGLLVDEAAGSSPVGVLVGIGVAVSGSAAALAGVLIVLGVIVFVVGAVVQTALMAIFRVALYRFATEDRVLGDFQREELESAFRPRRGRTASI